MAETVALNNRRSWMIVPAHDPAAGTCHEKTKPDVVVLDLEYSVPPKAKESARAGLGALVKKLGDSQVEVFVRIDRATRWADVRAAMHRGIKGIVFSGPDAPEEVAELDELITAMERERGIDVGATELVLMLESAKGFWSADAITQASPRVSALGVGRIDLTMRLGPVPQDEFRLGRFLMTRALVAARSDEQGRSHRPGPDSPCPPGALRACRPRRRCGIGVAGRGHPRRTAQAARR